MDVQSLFYTLGSIFLVLGIVVMISLLVLIFTAIAFFKKTQQHIEDVRSEVIGKVSSFVDSRRAAIAGNIGMGIFTFVINRVRDAFQKNKE